MIIRKVDGANDWLFGKGLSDYARDELAVQENIQTRVLSWLGDCFFALQEGVDWKSRLDVGQEQAILDDVKAVILQSFGVVAVNSIVGTFNSRSRLFTIEYQIQTIYSPSFEGVISQAAGS